MTHLFDATIFAIFVVILLTVSRPAPFETRDVQIWTDDIERRMLR